MKFLQLAIISIALSLFISCQNKEQEISVMQFNIWQEGTVIPNGYEAIVTEIAHHQPDFVTLSEVRNYNDVDFTNKLINDLKAHGLTYYSRRSEDSGLISRYPIESFDTIYPLRDDSGSIYKMRTHINGVAFAVYTAHLDYKDYAPFLTRGYSGKSFQKIDSIVTDTIEIRRMNLASKRDDAAKLFIADAQLERERGAVVIIGGDFNEPSFKDWREDTKDIYDHNGVVFDWDISRLFEDAGFIDSYRELYPSAVTHPGFTYPSDNELIPDEKMGKLTWAPDTDERERIDYILYAKHPAIELVDAAIYGPSKSIIRSERIEEKTQDKFILPQGIWPTDHKGLIIKLRLKP